MREVEAKALVQHTPETSWNMDERQQLLIEILTEAYEEDAGTFTATLQEELEGREELSLPPLMLDEQPHRLAEVDKEERRGLEDIA